MIRITIHLHSAIHQSRSRSLGSIVITNDGTGDNNTGHYKIVATRDGRRMYEGRVENFPRSSRSVLELLRRGLNDLHDKRELP